jgi:hypothetical protein
MIVRTIICEAESLPQLRQLNGSVEMQFSSG